MRMAIMGSQKGLENVKSQGKKSVKSQGISKWWLSGNPVMVFWAFINSPELAFFCHSLSICQEDSKVTSSACFLFL